MKHSKISLAVMVTLTALSTGLLSANSLAELRGEHADRNSRHQTSKVKRDKVHKRSAQKTIHKKRRTHRAASRKNSRNQKLVRAKNYQRKVDRRHKRKYAKRRNFRTVEQYRKVLAPQRYAKRTYSTNTQSNRWQRDRRNSTRRWTSKWRARHGHRGYKHSRRNWYLTYLFERASFTDRYGYKYGYFNRRGFMFEGGFYRYDRYYTYQDRLRGRGLFERRYYRPAYSRFNSFFADLDYDTFQFFARFDF